MRKLNFQAGFTLIELVSVLVILGILAAIAVPRFINLSVTARQAAVNGMLGAVSSAANLAHAQALVLNVVNGTITMENTTVNIVNSYPDGGAPGGIDAAMSNFSGFTFTFVAGSPATFQLNGASSPANCEVRYTNAPALGIPTITSDASGC